MGFNYLTNGSRIIYNILSDELSEAKKIISKLEERITALENK